MGNKCDCCAVSAAESELIPVDKERSPSTANTHHEDQQAQQPSLFTDAEVEPPEEEVEIHKEVHSPPPEPEETVEEVVEVVHEEVKEEQSVEEEPPPKPETQKPPTQKPPTQKPPMPPSRINQPPAGKATATAKPTNANMFAMGGVNNQVAMPPPPKQQATEEEIEDNKGDRGAGCYMTFEWIHQGAAFLEWSKTQPREVILFGRPRLNEELETLGLKGVPDHKYKGKKEPISRNMQGDPNSYYRGVCAFVKASAAHGCVLEMVPGGKITTPKELTIFAHYVDDRVSQTTWGEEFDTTEVDAVAAGPPKAKGYKGHMSMKEFISFGSGAGGVIKLK